MSDTPDHVRRVYADFIMQKSDADRFRMAFEMADIGQQIVETQFKQKYPDWSTGEIKAAVFDRIYRNDFSAETMERIKKQMAAYYQ